MNQYLNATKGNKSVPNDEKIERISNVIIEKVLSSRNGAQKFRFILELLHNITKSALFYI